MGVILTYNNSQILNLDDSGNKTIKTGGKYCEHDISLAFTKQPSGIACIYATYPVGWTCTCSNGQTAEDTSGEYLFFVEELGTYTITISNGTLSKSQSVNVSAKWRSYNVSLEVSYIHVTYPVGWTCTCTYGQQVQTATDTSGEFTFTALNTGMYSLRATNGSDEETANVNVSSYGQTYEAEIFDFPQNYIFKEGRFRDDITWTKLATYSAEFVIVDGNIQLRANSSGGTGKNTAEVSNYIDLAKYSTFHVLAKNESQYTDLRISCKNSSDSSVFSISDTIHGQTSLEFKEYTAPMYGSKSSCSLTISLSSSVQYDHYAYIKEMWFT